MTEKKKMLPIGIEFFEPMIRDGYYYVDKTGMIRELLENLSYVTLITRPRRFGKSLNMSMLETFFSPDSDKSVFDGLQIAQEIALCEKYMGQYPVISLSLKGIDAWDYEGAYDIAVLLIREAAQKYERVLSDSEILSASEKQDFAQLLNIRMADSTFFQSLRTLSSLLEKHYGRKVIILIDEYDVPLARAHEQGYYDRMAVLIRNLFHQTLKTNDSLLFAVLTGCMRISKESIFTGLNNLRVLSVSDPRFAGYFGFTDREVRDLLAYYDLSAKYEVIREWYDGYRFGGLHVYCPWDVINYCDLLRSDSAAFPQNYWINSSSNNVVRRFIRYSENATVRKEIEGLINGEAIEKTLRLELTYEDMYTSVENIWSVLFTTGYLTQREQLSGSLFRLAIPNQEIRTIFSEQIMAFFQENVKKDGAMLNRFCDALRSGDAAAAEKCLNEYLRRTISIRDTAVRKPMKENFYHGILLGILGVKDSWGVSSNREAGDGYYDILAETGDGGTAILIEVKYAEDGDLDAACRRALRQVEQNRYADELYYEGCDTVIRYGIAFYKKKCRVMRTESQ